MELACYRFQNMVADKMIGANPGLYPAAMTSYEDAFPTPTEIMTPFDVFLDVKSPELPPLIPEAANGIFEAVEQALHSTTGQFQALTTEPNGEMIMTAEPHSA